MKGPKIIAILLAAAILPAASGCQIKEWHATEEECKAASEAIETTELMRGIWITPRRNIMGTDKVADERFAEIAEAGINLVHIHPSDCYSDWFVKRQLKAAENNNIKVIIELPAPSNDEEIAENLEIVKYAIEYPSLYGFNLQDEPVSTRFEILKKEYDEVRKIAGENKYIFVNLLPNYGPSELMAPEVKKGYTWYQTYVNKCVDYDCSDIICFDYYPYRADANADKTNLTGLVSNICDIIGCANKNGRPAWSFIQDSSWAGTRIPGDAEVRFQTHLYLAFGFKSFTYFLYCQPDDSPGAEGIFEGMLTYGGKKTAIYERVQKINNELDGLRGRYLNYSFDGIYVKCAPDYISSAVSGNYKKSLSGYPVKDIKGSDILAGLFKGQNDSGAPYAVYVVNTNTGRENSVTVKFRRNSPYSVWGSGGIEDMGAADTVTIDLKPGEGKFIELTSY